MTRQANLEIPPLFCLIKTNDPLQWVNRPKATYKIGGPMRGRTGPSARYNMHARLSAGAAKTDEDDVKPRDRLP